jgi:hypothetical protein
MYESQITDAPTRRAIQIDARFEGWPGLANGGHLAGLLYRELGGPLEVTLRRPTPVAAPLSLSASATNAELSDEAGPLVTALRIDNEIELPEPVGFDRALDVRTSYRGFSHRLCPTCFVCGTHRSPVDALRIFAGELEPGRVAAAWIPGPAFGDDSGRVGVEHAVAALDCPGAWAIASARGGLPTPMLLGRLSVRCEAPVRVGLPHVVVGAATGEAGRKRFAATAVYDAGGRLCAAARSIWFPHA